MRRETLAGGEAYMTALGLRLKIFYTFQTVPGMLALGGSIHQVHYLSPEIPEAHPISGIQSCLEGAEHF